MNGYYSPPHASGVTSDFAALLGSLTNSTSAVGFRDTSGWTAMTSSQGESLANLTNSTSLSDTSLFTNGVKSDHLSLTDITAKGRSRVKGERYFLPRFGCQQSMLKVGRSC